MTDRLKTILDNLYKYNMEGLAKINFGLMDDVVYDALVVTPSYGPDICHSLPPSFKTSMTLSNLPLSNTNITGNRKTVSSANDDIRI